MEASATLGQRVGYAFVGLLGLVLIIKWRAAGRGLTELLVTLNAPRPQDRPGWRERAGADDPRLLQVFAFLWGLALLVMGVGATIFA